MWCLLPLSLLTVVSGFLNTCLYFNLLKSVEKKRDNKKQPLNHLYSKPLFVTSLGKSWFVRSFIYFSEIIATAERTDIAPHVKDGYIMMFIYMPVVFTNEFTPYIGQIITPILKVKHSYC